jgi:hypothetical protein
MSIGNLPEVLSREEWLAARKVLLAKEKELTRLRDRVNADRCRLPMVRIDKPYTFEGPDGRVGLPDQPDQPEPRGRGSRGWGGAQADADAVAIAAHDCRHVPGGIVPAALGGGAFLPGPAARSYRI